MKYILRQVLGYWNAYWYIRLIIVVIFSIFCFAILVQIFKEIGFLPAKKIFDFLDNWATVLSAAVMLMLAGAAVWAIMDNRHGRIVDRRERLLNEIIEWATDIGKCDIKIDVISSLGITGKNKTIVARSWYHDMVDSFRALEVRSVYISKIVLKFEDNLQKAVKALKEHLKTHIELVNECANSITKPEPDERYESAADDETKHKRELNQFANKVIEEAAKIKTRDIS